MSRQGPAHRSILGILRSRWLEHSLARLYLRAEPLAPGFVGRIHRRDEMLHNARVHYPHRLGNARFDYFRSGAEVVRVLENVLGHAGRELSSLGRVLEFACGHGRVTRHLVGRVDPSRIWSSDIVDEAVTFVRNTFGVHTLVSTQEPDALELPEGFDLIVVSSLFSHLPRERFAAWLARLGRALSPTGLLVFSTHGDEVFPEVPKHPSGFTFVPRSETRVLDLAEYGSAFVTPQVVEALAREAGLGFVTGLPRELWHYQDVYVASAAQVPGLERWRHASGLEGVLDVCAWSRSGGVRLEGWVGETCPDENVVEVRLECRGRATASARIGLAREDVAAARQRPDWARGGWSVDDLGYVPTPGDVLVVRAVSSSGHSAIVDLAPVGGRLRTPSPPGAAAVRS